VIDFYFNASPNPMKVALFLEEAGLPYRPVPVDTFRGAQFSSEFSELNPNGKVPVIVDNGTVVFDSSAILLYLAQKHGRFSPAASDHPGMLSWLMFVASGLGPFCGQAVHFRHYAPEPKAYAETRYAFEARRHFGILDAHLADRDWMVGADYSIIDMSVWAWGRHVDLVVGPEARPKLPHLMRLVETIEARPAAQAVLTLLEQHKFQRDFDEEARRHMFRHMSAN
jgi:GST-like protein